MHTFLADVTLNGDGDPTSGPAAPGLIAFLIIVVLGLVLWFLLKNMGKQLGRANKHFEAEAAREAQLSEADTAAQGDSVSGAALNS